MGVMTRGPVWAVPMTAPPCQINGGFPLAGWPASWQSLLAGWAAMMPLRAPTRTDWGVFVTQVPAADGPAVAANADPPVRAVAPATTRIRVARKLRCLNAVLIRASARGDHLTLDTF